MATTTDEPLRLSELSTEYVHVDVTVTVAGSGIDPLTADASMAFPAKGARPVTGDWHDALLSGTSTRLVAKCLVGPEGGEVELPVGRYDVWVRLVDDPEKPVHKAPVGLVIF